ncbi:MAG: hypothetical protein SGPRY_006262 [Prymnesium sp.]
MAGSMASGEESSSSACSDTPSSSELQYPSTPDDTDSLTSCSEEGGEATRGPRARSSREENWLLKGQLVLLGVLIGISCTQFRLVDAHELLRSLFPARSDELIPRAGVREAALPVGWSEYLDEETVRLARPSVHE